MIQTRRAANRKAGTDSESYASSRRKPHVEFAAGRLGVSQKRLGARQGMTAL